MSLSHDAEKCLNPLADARGSDYRLVRRAPLPAPDANSHRRELLFRATGPRHPAPTQRNGPSGPRNSIFAAARSLSYRLFVRFGSTSRVWWFAVKSASAYSVPVATAEQGPLPQPDGLILLEARRGALVVAIGLRYAFIRELRGMLKSPEDSASGLLFGRYASDSATIEHCGAGEGARSPIGVFRTQAGGLAAITGDDCKRIQSAISASAQGALFLVVRTYPQRPWTATLFAVDPRQPTGAGGPLLEFPFDEYLLRNDSLNELSPPAAQQFSPAAIPRPHVRVPWVALAVAAALIGGGAAAYRYQWRTPDLPPPPGSAIALSVIRSLDELEVSWNRTARAVRTATDGTLTIRNGPVLRKVPVSAEQLREGRIMYHPVAGADTDFRLEIRMPDGRSLAESFQVLEFGAPPSTVIPVAFTPPRKTPPRQRQVSERADMSRVTAPSEPVAIRRVNPTITPKVQEEIRAAQGKVTISVLVAIDANGRVETAKVVSSTGEPSAAAGRTFDWPA